MTQHTKDKIGLAIVVFVLLAIIALMNSCANQIRVRHFPITGELIDTQSPIGWKEKCLSHLYALAFTTSEGIRDISSGSLIEFESIFQIENSQQNVYYQQIRQPRGALASRYGDLVGALRRTVLVQLNSGNVELRFWKGDHGISEVRGYGFCTFNDLESNTILEVGFNVQDIANHNRTSINTREIRFSVRDDTILEPRGSRRLRD